MSIDKSEISTFVEQYGYTIDFRRYMHDIDIDDADIMARYQDLISQNRYTDAKNLLYDSDVFSFSAWFFNMVKNRLTATYNYLERVAGPRPELTKYRDPEPPGVPLWTTWITESDYFSDLYSVTINPSINGTAYSVPAKDIPSSTIQLYVNSDFGYAIDQWNVVSGGVQVDSDNTFVLGNSDVVITPTFKLASMNSFPIYVSSYRPRSLTSNGAVFIDIDLDAKNDSAIYSNTEPTGVSRGSCWIGDA